MTQLAGFIPSIPLKTAVLFLVFNRPDTTAQVFKAIRKAKPPRLYVAADGSRPGRKGEAEKVAKVREIATEVDWHCEIKTLFRNDNLGCKHAVSGAITWFFENEEQGIILEDDCVPNQSFFWFCESLLNLYKNNMSIGIISGNNFYDRNICSKTSYHFSIHGGIWGWASWSRVWRDYTPDLINLDPIKIGNLKKKLNNKFHSKALISQLHSIKSGKLDTWDVQFAYMRYMRGYLCVRPKNNLVSNIGLGHIDASHTKMRNNDNCIYTESNDLAFPLKHPSAVIADVNSDNRLSSQQYKSNYSYGRIKKNILNFLKIINPSKLS